MARWKRPKPLQMDGPTLKAIADPVRLQILLELDEPMTVKEVADVIDAPPTRLYYHFKILEEAGLIRVTGRRRIRGVEERTYLAVDESYTPPPDAVAEVVKAGLVGTLLGVVRAQLELAMNAGADAGEELGQADSTVPVLSLSRLQLTKGDARDLQREIQSLVREYQPKSRPEEGSHHYQAMFAVFKSPGELRNVIPPNRNGVRRKGDGDDAS